MDIDLDENQILIRDTLEKMLRTEFPYARRSAVLASEAGWDENLWRGLAKLGYLGMFLDLELGGAGASAAETTLVMKTLGEAQVVEPYLQTSIFGAQILNALGPCEAVERLATGLGDGNVRFAVAANDLQSGGAENPLRVHAGERRLIGQKRLVLGANGATHYLFPICTDEFDAASFGVVVIPINKQGLQARTFRLHDGTRGADLQFDNVVVQPDEIFTATSFGIDGYRRVCAFALLGICAEATGCMAALLRQTVGYTKSRKQFDVTLSSFQVLQHVMADMWMQLEQANALVAGAASLLANDDPAAPSTLSATKAFIGRSGRFIGQKAVQLHGGMGLSEALPIGQYFKRLTVIEMLLGTSAEHEERYLEEAFGIPVK